MVNNRGQSQATIINMNESQQTKRNIGLRICQINVEGMSRAKAEYISKLAVEENLNATLVKETHTTSDEELGSRGVVAGFNMVVAEHLKHHGIATYVKEGMDEVNVVESSTNNTIYSSVTKIGSLSVTNVYKTPAEQWSDTPLPVQPHPSLYTGDFNSHHSE